MSLTACTEALCQGQEPVSVPITASIIKLLTYIAGDVVEVHWNLGLTSPRVWSRQALGWKSSYQIL